MHPKDISSASNEAILREILDVITSLKNGHFTAHVTDNLPGVAGEIATTLNGMIQMLQDFRDEHHRIMEEVSVTGRLGGQMDVSGLSGAWKQMTEDVNQMGVNVTCQFRDGWNVARALLAGDVSARMTCSMIQGEWREFRERFNEIADRLEQGSAEPVPA